jgi:hypothetical protein
MSGQGESPSPDPGGGLPGGGVTSKSLPDGGIPHKSGESDDEALVQAVARLRRWVRFRQGQKSRADAPDPVSDDILLLCAEVERQGREG